MIIAMGSSWQQLQDNARDFAASVRKRFEANTHHILGTVRPNGAPLDKDLRTGDAKLIGRLRPNDELDIAPGSAFIFDIEMVSLVQVDGDELFFKVWRSESGLSEIRRS